MSLRSIHHIAVYTRRYPEMELFYTEMLELPVIGRLPGRDIVFLGIGDTTLELIGMDTIEGKYQAAAASPPSAGPTGPMGFAHVTFEVDNIEETYRELQERGVAFHIPPMPYPPEDPVFRLAFFHDPDANVLEILQPIHSRYPQPVPEPLSAARSRQIMHRS